MSGRIENLESLEKTMFSGANRGILVRLTGSGEWMVKREGQQNAYPWNKRFWKKVPACVEVKQ